MAINMNMITPVQGVQKNCAYPGHTWCMVTITVSSIF